MDIALMSASMLERPWEAVLDTALEHGVTVVEACAGGHIPKHHYDPTELASDDAAFERFAETLASRGMTLCAMSCHGNPLHPDPSMASSVHDDFAATCEIAAKLGVPHVSLLAGCPGGGPEDHVPNWIINATFPTFSEAYAWQWAERVIPYWRRAAEVADRYDVKICVEPHSADVVYNFKTFFRLRNAIGDTIGMNYDPSHMWWQGVDPLVFIAEAGDAIYTCHVKDVDIDARAVALDGILSPEEFHAWDKRPWTFSTPGCGHSQQFWSQYVRALRGIGYDGALSIECEDPFTSPDDTLEKAVAVLRAAIPTHTPPPMDWAEATGVGGGALAAEA
jgi:sugar phosphate isomerase/epimerase